MSQQRPVPRLDLAPKLKRPLSLRKPLDYLRLLYWVFYFPQALRWYVDSFGGGNIPEEEMNWQNSIKLRLLLQGVILTVVTSVLLYVIVLQLGVSIIRSGVAFGFGVAFGVMFGVGGHLAFGVAFGVVFGAVFGVAFGVIFGMAFGVAFGVAFSMAFGMAGMAFDVGRGVAVGVIFGMAFGMAFDMERGDVAGGVAFTVVVGVAILRPENWLIDSVLYLRSFQNGSWLLPHVTLLPLPYLARHLRNWLQQDWETGIHNVNQLLVYTLQFIPVVQAINRVLATTPSEQVIWRVSRLAENPFDWKLVRFTSASLKAAMISDSPKILLDTPARAAAAGFWYLHKKEPAKAMEAFAVVRSLLYGEEMFTLAQTLAACEDTKESSNIANLQLPAFPTQQLLRPITWQAVNSFSRVVEDVRLVQRSVSQASRSFALNRALGELKNILNNQDSLPKAERALIVNIAKTWQEALLNIAGEVGEITITKRVRNPYTVGDPVEGSLFVGREDVMRQLEELWVMGQQLQSVLIYGHRRMGKTSILRNAANCLGSGVKVAYVNLLGLGDLSEVLMAISDAISEVVNLEPPNDDDHWLKFPKLTFERYLKKIVETQNFASLQGLIIALDEFETIEELIEAEKIPTDFMGFLRKLVQMNSKVAFALAGLHTLDEMTRDYFQPFYGSFINIRVSFIERAATRQLLANPDEDFPLDYTPEALDQIYALTHGQPYLVQLMGFLLVRRYNDFVFEQGRSRNPTFTVEDVEAVVDDPKFFEQGNYYFDGVWGQALQGAAGQQEILEVLALHPEGLSLEAINMDDESLQEALKTLKRHDVIEENEGRWRIVVELFRRWVSENKMS